MTSSAKRRPTPVRHSLAAVLTGPGRVELKRLPLPTIGLDGALLAVEATGVCGSDVAAFHGHLKADNLPFVLGHEVVGTIAEIGAEASERWGVKAGDRVVVEEYLYCGRCPECIEGEYQLCAYGRRYGGESIGSPPGLWGGFSEYMYLHPCSLVHRIDFEVDPHLAQLFIPLANGIYWVNEVAETRVGDTVVVVGPGPHGLSCVVGAREAGAGTIVVVGRQRDENRLALARSLGATHTLVVDDGNVVERLREVTDGRLARSVINTASSPSGLELAVGLAGNRGVIVQAALTDGPTSLDGNEIVRKKLTIKGVRGRPSRVVRSALRVMQQGNYPLEQLCTHTFAIEDTAEAIGLVASGNDGVCRASVGPGIRSIKEGR